MAFLVENQFFGKCKFDQKFFRPKNKKTRGASCLNQNKKGLELLGISLVIFFATTLEFRMVVLFLLFLSAGPNP